MSKPSISVVMICYNHEKYIAEAIDSILSQTYTDFELIIVDDGSTDNTFEIIQDYDDPRVTALTQINSGPSVALNTGISKSIGKYIAFMSGDDVSFPNRLEIQLKQLEVRKADMVFSVPQIIDPNSEILGLETCPWFYGREFESTAELYRSLFYLGNFLCAPSCFCRRTALEKVGRFRRGLVQLQDFDYWIRACKKNIDIRLFTDPLIQYRHLFGANLSDKSNSNRAKVETAGIYRNFFDDVPVELLYDAFSDKVTLDTSDNNLDVEIDKSFLFLSHTDALIKLIGMERIIRQFEDDEIYEKLKNERAFDTASLFQLTESISIDNVGKLRKVYSYIGGELIKLLRFSMVEGPRWTETQIKQRIQHYMELGDYKRAIMLARGSRKFPPGLTLLSTIHKVLAKFKKLVSVPISIIRTNLAKTNPKQSPLTKRVFSLSRMYNYCQQKNCIVYEDLPETIYIRRPKLYGDPGYELAEGKVFCPPAYVAIVDDAIISTSSLVLTHNGDILNDEMVDFVGEEYGTKSLYVQFRSMDKVLLAYNNGLNTKIKEGILLSCDHDFNYFHWLVETLPKLLLIDDLKQFKDVPLLIPKGLHKNLKVALNRVNINNHPIIYLDNGVAYQVKRLIFPSALSRVNDRYMGYPIFGVDIVLSHKWISRVADHLKSGELYNKKPWRKLYLTRRKKGLRSLGNRKEIELMLLEQSFEIVELDEVSLDYQIELFSQASVIVAPTGAALTNMLFCQPGTKVIIFMSDHEASNYYFWPNLGNIFGLEVEIIIGERLYKLVNYWSVHDDYSIDPNIVLDEIKKVEH